MKTRIDTRHLVAALLGASMALGGLTSAAAVAHSSEVRATCFVHPSEVRAALFDHPSEVRAALFDAESATTLERTTGWVCDRADSICGLDDPKMLSSPAKVDYDALYKSTSEYKKIRDDKIDPNSSEGIQLRQRAVDRIREKTESIRAQKGHCSVWKTIRHTDARTVPDITDQVKALL